VGLKVFTVGSLFSGIGGLELGLEWTGRFKTVWQVENNEYCRRVLAKHWPDAKRYEDVRDVGRENLEAVDVICGGFPCQDISVAGKREGIREGNRSGLWYEYARIIRELRPQYVVVENVPALLTGGGIGVVLGELASIGYDAEWRVLSAANVGAPHLRERVFLVAYSASSAHSWRRPAVAHQWLASDVATDAEQGGADVADNPSIGRGTRRQGRFDTGSSRESKQALRHSASEGLPDWSGGKMGQPCPVTELERSGGREVERDFRGMAHGVSRRVDRIRALGNAVVPQCARVIGEWLLEIDEELNGESAA
jgi:DNA (cytosine-5)-methyltransferase 1